jgi:hypothetical protein
MVGMLGCNHDGIDTLGEICLWQSLNKAQYQKELPSTCMTALKTQRMNATHAHGKTRAAVEISTTGTRSISKHKALPKGD